jgi:hypothetical protein
MMATKFEMTTCWITIIFFRGRLLQTQRERQTLLVPGTEIIRTRISSTLSRETTILLRTTGTVVGTGVESFVPV